MPRLVGFQAGQTALSVAAEAGHVSVVEALIHGDPNLPLNHADKVIQLPNFPFQPVSNVCSDSARRTT
jgi:hypothetical protein